MKKVFACLCLAGSMFGATLHNRTALTGDYVEARTADVYTGPCYANSEVELVGNLAVFGWKIKQGSFQGVTLDGLSVVGVIKASGTLGNVHGEAYPVKATLIVDNRANVEQRVALQKFAQRMGGDLLQNIVKVDYEPVEFTFEGDNVHAAKAKLSAGSLARIQTRAINEGDHHCSNESTWYAPLTKLDHAMPAFALAHSYSGSALNTKWSSPEKRSAFVGSFHLAE